MNPSAGNQSGSDAVARLVSARRQARRKLIGHLVLARDDERRRLASDLHGAPLQSMAAVAARLEWLRGRVDDDLRAEVRDLERSVDDAVARLRRLAYDLSVSAAEELLGPAVESRLGAAEEASGLRWSLMGGVLHEPSSATRVATLRILDEVLLNVRTHARATRVDVTVEAAQGVFVRVEDDGAGFDPAEVKARPSRMGLCLMRQRAEAAGGWVRVESAPGKGTIVEFFIPED